MRDLIALGMMLLLVPMSLRNGYIAYLLWGWAGLASVTSYLYGFMLGFQYSLVFSLIALTLFLLGNDPRNKPFESNRTTTLFLLFAVQVVLSASFAYDGHPRNWEIATNVLKTLVFCALMPLVVTTRFRLHGLILMMAIATGYHGLVDGLKYISSGGSHFAYGIQKYGDNNHFAIALVMVIPLLVYCFRYAANPLVRLGFATTTPLVVLAVLATQSRGGFMCLLTVGIWFALTSRYKFVGIVGIALSALLVLQLAPDQWLDRMNTIGAAGEDYSMMGRIGAWRISSAIAIANPFFGGGLHSVEIASVWNSFRDSPNLLWYVTNLDLEGLPGGGRAAHSIYFETMGDLGFVGFFIFMALLFNALVTAREVVALVRVGGNKLRWAADLAHMLSISVIAYAVGGALLSAAYFELPYILFMLLEVLKRQVRAALHASDDKSALGLPDTSRPWL
jgi:probable O-glycosylation ligase (exosortase A-associated)